MSLTEIGTGKLESRVMNQDRRLYPRTENTIISMEY